QQALTLLQELDDRLGQAQTWDSLGYAHQHLGHRTQALTCYQHALTLFRDLGDRYNQADTLTPPRRHAPQHRQPPSSPRGMASGPDHLRRAQPLRRRQGPHQTRWPGYLTRRARRPGHPPQWRTSWLTATTSASALFDDWFDTSATLFLKAARR